jgi:hypothetical protein
MDYLSKYFLIVSSTRLLTREEKKAGCRKIKGASHQKLAHTPGFSLILKHLLQAGINVSRTAAVRCVAGDVQKLTFLFTFRAGFRWQRGGQSIAAFTAFPNSLGWSCCGHFFSPLALIAKILLNLTDKIL